MSKGFVYAIINPSIKDAVKVGKTERSPEKRAEELSAATGVATKFIVAYYDFFNDCSAAEEYVHAKLETLGYRISNNREFFSAPLHQVVKAISEAPGQMDMLERDSASDEDDQLLTQNLDDEINSLNLENYKKPEPWADLLEQADAAYHGSGSVLQDFSAALRLYKQAAKLGCAEAYEKIGQMYLQSEGVQEDKSKALEYWKVGAQKGSWLCYGNLTSLFIQTEHESNAKKCFLRFIEGVEKNKNEWIESEGFMFVNLIYKILTIDRLISFHKMNFREIQMLSPLKKDFSTALGKRNQWLNGILKQGLINTKAFDSLMTPNKLFNEFLLNILS